MWSFSKEKISSANRRRIFGKENHFLSTAALVCLLSGRIKSAIKASLLLQKCFPQRRVVQELIKSPALSRSCSIAEPLVCSSPKDYLDLWFRHKAGRASSDVLVRRWLGLTMARQHQPCCQDLSVVLSGLLTWCTAVKGERICIE